MVPSILAALNGFVLLIVPASLAGAVIETLIPGENQTWLSRLRAIPIWAIFITLGVSLGAALAWCWGELHVRPLVQLDLRKTTAAKDWPTLILAFTVYPALSAFIYDFFYYWFHRLQHKNRMAWRVHAVHHSIEELNAFNDYHHWARTCPKVSVYPDSDEPAYRYSGSDRGRLLDTNPLLWSNDPCKF